MRKFKFLGTICAAVAMITTGVAVAGPMTPSTASLNEVGLNSQFETVVMKGTKAGRMKQRSRTRTTLCRSQPSRC